MVRCVFEAGGGKRDAQAARGLGDVFKRQLSAWARRGGGIYQTSIHPDFWVFDRSWGQMVPDHEIRS